MKNYFLILIFSLFSTLLWASSSEVLQPAALIYVEDPNISIILVDKSECSVIHLQYDDGWKKRHSYSCTTGSKEGDKFRENDLKTPVGVYHFSDTWKRKELLRYYGKSALIYGAGAFEMNYPNYIDKVFDKKDGYGIWLHGTDKTDPTETKGCIAVRNDAWIEISQWIELEKTPIIIQEQIEYTQNSKILEERSNILATLKDWRSGWESEDLSKYLSHYSNTFKTERFNYNTWNQYKQIVNETNKNRKIILNDISILKAKKVYHVTFIQNYSSSKVNDIGRKSLYFKKEGDQYRIIGEQWKKLKRNLSQQHFVYKGEEKKNSL